ncbi:MAG: SPOR domain-containing protein [Steroidobacteraceae bacterium]
MKERLTGAIILVALIVLLVPELLTGPIRAEPAAASSTAASASTGVAQTAHEAPLRSYTLTLEAAPPQVHDASAAPAEASAQPAVAPEQSVPPNPVQSLAQSPAPKTVENPGTAARSDLQAAKAPAHPAVPEVHSSASAGGWVVQLGSFASRQNADRLARSLKRKGFHMSVSPAHSRARVLWRVRAGPAHDRAGAEHLAARLRALGHRGEVLPVR